MANVINVNFKLDADVKKEYGKTCSEIGLSISAAFTVFVKKVTQKNVPLKFSGDQFYSEEIIHYLENVVHDIAEGKVHFAEHELLNVD